MNGDLSSAKMYSMVEGCVWQCQTRLEYDMHSGFI